MPKLSTFVINIKNKICSKCKFNLCRNFEKYITKIGRVMALQIYAKKREKIEKNSFFQITSKRQRIVYFIKNKNDSKCHFTPIYQFSKKKYRIFQEKNVFLKSNRVAIKNRKLLIMAKLSTFLINIKNKNWSKCKITSVQQF